MVPKVRSPAHNYSSPGLLRQSQSWIRCQVVHRKINSLILGTAWIGLLKICRSFVLFSMEAVPTIVAQSVCRWTNDDSMTRVVSKCAFDSEFLIKTVSKTVLGRAYWVFPRLLWWFVETNSRVCKCQVVLFRKCILLCVCFCEISGS